MLTSKGSRSSMERIELGDTGEQNGAKKARKSIHVNSVSLIKSFVVSKVILQKSPCRPAQQPGTGHLSASKAFHAGPESYGLRGSSGCGATSLHTPPPAAAG